MAKEKKNSSKKKKIMRFSKLYISACIISLVLGLTAFGIAQNISRSALELNNQEIKIPSYEEIIKENEKKIEQKQETIENEVPKTPEPIGETEEILSESEDVKVIEITETETEKEITFTAPCGGTLLKRFSVDKPLESKTMGDFRTHSGVDIKVGIGTEVYAAADGTVESVYNDNLLGKTVIVSHNEKLKTQYSNLTERVMLKEGQEIKAGDVIGSVGNTAKGELLDDAHLHFAMLSEEKYVNPEDYVIIEKTDD